MTILDDFLRILESIAGLVPLVHDIIQGEITLDKSKTIIIKTRKRFKKESHFLVTPVKKCTYTFKDIRSLTSKLEELKRLKDKKLITAEEHERMKKELLLN